MKSANSTRYKIRIAINDRQKWHGFTLRRGHFYFVEQNCDGSEDLIVTALEPGENGTVKVYAANASNEKWDQYLIPADDELILKVVDAAENLRAKSGITEVSHTTMLDEIRAGKCARIMKRNGKMNTSNARVFC